MGRLNIDRQNRLEPERLKHAKKKIEELGYIVEEGDKVLIFEFRGEKVRFFYYSGWHSGKTIEDGRGLQNLLKQIRK